MGGTTAKASLIEACTPLIGYSFEAGREQRLPKGSGITFSILTIKLIQVVALDGHFALLQSFALPKDVCDSVRAVLGTEGYI